MSTEVSGFIVGLIVSLLANLLAPSKFSITDWYLGKIGRRNRHRLLARASAAERYKENPYELTHHMLRQIVRILIMIWGWFCGLIGCLGGAYVWRSQAGVRAQTLILFGTVLMIVSVGSMTRATLKAITAYTDVYRPQLLNKQLTARELDQRELNTIGGGRVKDQG